jgi:hypothetical protein
VDNEARHAQIVDEVGFEPCREDRCPDDSIHPAHPEDFGHSRSSKFFMTSCPLCSAKLIRLPRRRARCSVCSWRGKNDRRRGWEQRHQLKDRLHA